MNRAVFTPADQSRLVCSKRLLPLKKTNTGRPSVFITPKNIPRYKSNSVGACWRRRKPCRPKIGHSFPIPLFQGSPNYLLPVINRMGDFTPPWNKNLKVPPQYVTSQSHTRRHFKFELDIFSGQRIPDTFSAGSGSRYFFFHPAGNEIAHNFLLPIRFFFFFFLFHSLTRHLAFFVIQSPGHSFFNKRFYKSVPP